VIKTLFASKMKKALEVFGVVSTRPPQPQLPLKRISLQCIRDEKADFTVK
jgi:hypothetical protein